MLYKKTIRKGKEEVKTGHKGVEQELEQSMKMEQETLK